MLTYIWIIFNEIVFDAMLTMIHIRTDLNPRRIFPFSPLLLQYLATPSTSDRASYFPRSRLSASHETMTDTACREHPKFFLCSVTSTLLFLYLALPRPGCYAGSS